MRVFGVPALTGSRSARLTDTVFRRAGAEPGAVVLRGGPTRVWRDCL